MAAEQVGFADGNESCPASRGNRVDGVGGGVRMGGGMGGGGGWRGKGGEGRRGLQLPPIAV